MTRARPKESAGPRIVRGYRTRAMIAFSTTVR